MKPSSEKGISKIQVLLEAGALPPASPWRTALIHSDRSGAADHLLRAVDASDFSLEDWLASLHLLEDFLQRREIALPKFHEALGYLECCAQSTETGLNHYTLAEVAQLMLDEHGFAGEE